MTAANRDLFSAISPEALSKDDILRCFESNFNDPASVKADKTETLYPTLLKADHLHQEIFHNLNDLLVYYANTIAIDAVRNSSKTQRDLYWVLLHLSARITVIREKAGLVTKPEEELKKRIEQLNQCIRLINQFDLNRSYAEIAPTPLSLTSTANWAVEESIRRNQTRLFWVWVSAFERLQFGFFNQTEAQQNLDNTGNITGVISWALYFVLGTIYLGKYLDKRCNRPEWIDNSAESALLKKSYLEKYWNEYKYRIINDFVWGPINLACFFWWYGNGFFGALGAVATAVLLIQDVCLALLHFNETKESFDLVSQAYERDIALLNQGIKDTKDIEVAFLKMQDSIDLQRRFENFKLRQESNMALEQWGQTFSWSLLLSFLVCAAAALVALINPVAGIMVISVNLLNIAGTTLCFALTFIDRIYKFNQEYLSRLKNIELLKKDQNEYKEHFKIMAKAGFTDGYIVDRKHTLFLLINHAKAHQAYEEKMLCYLSLEFARTSFFRVAVPLAIGFALIFPPSIVMVVPAYIVFILAILLLSQALSWGLEHLTKSYQDDANQALKTDMADNFHADYEVFQRAAFA